VDADEDKYLTNPYDLTIKEGKAYGLGVIDMKCFTSSVMLLVEKLKEYRFPIVLVLTGDEESNLYGVNNIIDEFKKLMIKPKFTIVGEPTSFDIKNVSNGCYEYEVEVYGKGCHSSTPKNGINAICVVARLVTFIEELANKYNNLTMSCDLISGGSIINRVAEYSSMSFDIRTTSNESYREVLLLINNKIEELKDVYKANIQIQNKLAIPVLNPKNNEKIEVLAKTLNLNITSFTGGCEAGYFSEYSGESILFGVGDLSLAHKPNEYLVINDYIKYNDKLVEMIDSLEELYF